ncbi:hypothetical protein J5J10_10490 [Ciceribacter sp. L1K23]|uniref:hypothetical protein n=1 Tax=Ciceribacter sp. L1K23 TaxID=2820276 RepID=UPI001B839BDB|nr:hypothetical protein [Ciceribacter sp. L1K23]MBR0556104.1 hypothetical protein [Ciceribacter sp. L1K23]
MSGVISSKKLLVFVLGIAALALLTSDLRQRDLVEAAPAFAIAVSLALANLAVSVAGLRTRQRWLWATYLAASIAAFLLSGFSTPIGAAIILAPVGIELAADFMREAWRPS